MLRGRIDLGEDEVGASAHAVGATISERFSVQAIWGDDVLKLRELTGPADPSQRLAVLFRGRPLAGLGRRLI